MGGTGEKAQALIERCRRDGWPFVLRAKVPADPGALFPLKFAWQGVGREGGMESRYVRTRKNKINESDLSTFEPTDFDDDAEEGFELDLFEDWFSSSLA